MNPREKTKMALGNNAVFRKTMKNIRKYRDIKLVTTEARKNYLVSEENYHTTKIFPENLLLIEITKTQILTNYFAYLDQSVLELSKMVMYEFWYDYVKTKYGGKVKLCFMDTDNFIVHIKVWVSYKKILKPKIIKLLRSNSK